MSVKSEDGKSWMNRNEKFILRKIIPLHLRKRDATVTRIMKKIDRYILRSGKMKESIIDDIQKYTIDIQKIEGITPKKVDGNLSLSDYANLNLVELSTNETIEFDEKLNIAKRMIDKCLMKWTKGGNEYIQSIVQEAFNVDKKGRVNTYMILRLTKLDIKDSDWKKAVKLITDSMNTTGSKQYLKFKTRKNKSEKLETLNLNFSSL